MWTKISKRGIEMKSDEWDKIEKQDQTSREIKMLKEAESQVKHEALIRFLTGYDKKEGKKLSIRDRLNDLRFYLIRVIVEQNYINKYDEEVNFSIIIMPSGSSNWHFSLSLHWPQNFDLTIPNVISIYYHVWEREGYE